MLVYCNEDKCCTMLFRVENAGGSHNGLAAELDSGSGGK